MSEELTALIWFWGAVATFLGALVVSGFIIRDMAAQYDRKEWTYWDDIRNQERRPRPPSMEDTIKVAAASVTISLAWPFVAASAALLLAFALVCSPFLLFLKLFVKPAKGADE